MLALAPDAPGLVFEERTYPWAYHLEAVEDLENAIGESGAHRVGIVLRNRPAHHAALIAVLATGREAVTLSPFHGDIALAEDITALRPQVVIAAPEDWDRDGVAKAAADVRAIAVRTGDGRALRPHPADWHAEPCAHAPSDVAVRMLTSGTTGRPKRIELGYDALTAAFDAAGHGAAMTDPQELKPGTAILWAPLMHISGLYFAVGNVLEGKATALLERFDVTRWSELVRVHRPKLVSLQPTAMRMVLDAEVPREVFDGVRAVLSGTAPLDPADAERFEARYGVPVLATYGATEFAGAVAGWSLRLRREWGDTKRGSVGRAHNGVELRVVDPGTRDPLPPGEIGVLEARGGQLPAASDAWTATTDLASIDADGFLFIHGRTDDAINRGGFKIVPSVLEDALKDHPAVRDACVVGLPDARLGEVPVAAVTVGEAVGEAALRTFLEERLARYQLPADIRVVAALPRTPSLKASRPEVRALFEDGV
ncbi:long-chain fatty acid--CoA ligase [Actinomadura sp. KC345]|nr:long-chain fatty acid--CoA ligase [Actinomadura sp. KC345]